MTLQIPLVVGTLKIKSQRQLRSFEKDGKVPLISIGPLFFVWMARAWKNGHRSN